MVTRRSQQRRATGRALSPVDQSLDQSDGHIRLYVAGDAPLMVAPVAGALSGFGITLSDVKIGEPSLEDVFINLTGRALR